MKNTTVKTIEAGSKPKKGHLKETYPTKSDALLRGLELMTEYYSLGLNETPLSNEMKDLEKEAVDYTTVLNQIKEKERSDRADSPGTEPG